MSNLSLMNYINMQFSIKCNFQFCLFSSVHFQIDQQYTFTLQKLIIIHSLSITNWLCSYSWGFIVNWILINKDIFIKMSNSSTKSIPIFFWSCRPWRELLYISQICKFFLIWKQITPLQFPHFLLDS